MLGPPTVAPTRLRPGDRWDRLGSLGKGGGVGSLKVNAVPLGRGSPASSCIRVCGGNAAVCHRLPCAQSRLRCLQHEGRPVAAGDAVAGRSEEVDAAGVLQGLGFEALSGDYGQVILMMDDRSSLRARPAALDVWSRIVGVIVRPVGMPSYQPKRRAITRLLAAEQDPATMANMTAAFEESCGPWPEWPNWQTQGT